MQFHEKLRSLREGRKMTQVECALAIDVSLRAYQNYESGRLYPRDPSVLTRISNYFGITVDELINGREMFLMEAKEKFGALGMKQAERILRQTEALYAGGSLSPEDEEAFYEHMMEIFVKAKARNAARYAARREGKAEG